MSFSTMKMLWENRWEKEREAHRKIWWMVGLGEHMNRSISSFSLGTSGNNKIARGKASKVPYHDCTGQRKTPRWYTSHYGEINMFPQQEAKKFPTSGSPPRAEIYNATWANKLPLPHGIAVKLLAISIFCSWRGRGSKRTLPSFRCSFG